MQTKLKIQFLYIWCHLIVNLVLPFTLIQRTFETSSVRRWLENIEEKVETVLTKQFLLFPQRFLLNTPVLLTIFPCGIFPPRCLTLSLIQQFCSRRLWTYFVKKWKISIIEWITYDYIKAENIVAKGEIACFQKAVCCRGVRKHIYEGKG